MIPVIWHYVRWQGCTALINDWFSGPQFEHFETMKDAPQRGDRAVFVIHGDHEKTKVSQVLEDVQKFKHPFCIIIGESGEFPAFLLKPYCTQVWEQSPDPNGMGSRGLILGYPPDCPSLLSGHDVLAVDKKYNWFFAGQVTHNHRQKCVEQLRTLKNGFLLETPGFWQGLSRPEYYATLAQSKIVPCPSGPETPDTFRIWEALEAGCVPIVDMMCPKREINGFWNKVLQSPPFPIIQDWSDLPQFINSELFNWPHNRDKLFHWWMMYKMSLGLEAKLACQMYS